VSDQVTCNEDHRVCNKDKEYVDQQESTRTGSRMSTYSSVCTQPIQPGLCVGLFFLGGVLGPHTDVEGMLNVSFASMVLLGESSSCLCFSLLCVAERVLVLELKSGESESSSELDSEVDSDSESDSGGNSARLSNSKGFRSADWGSAALGVEVKLGPGTGSSAGALEALDDVSGGDGGI
jgi:hypothetical protein